MPFNKVRTNLFLTKKSYFKTKEKVNLILSPEFYWVREFEIPVKNKKEAMNFIPNLFSDILPNDVFSYFAIKKKEGKFLAFAYKSDEIMNYAKRSNLELVQILNVYFGQTELKEINAFNISGDSFQYTSDEVLVKLPFSLENNELTNEKLTSLNLSKHRIKIEFYNSLMDKKYITSFIAILSVIAALNFFKYAIYLKNIDIVQMKENQLKQNYKLPSSLLETESILKSMRKKFKKDEKLRLLIGVILDYKQHDRSASFRKIIFNSKEFVLEFKNINKNKLESYFKSKFKKVRINELKESTKVVLSYE